MISRFGADAGWPGEHWISTVRERYQITDKNKFGVFHNLDALTAFITRELIVLDGAENLIQSVKKSNVRCQLLKAIECSRAQLRALRYLSTLS